jgi:hypothetical protein
MKKVLLVALIGSSIFFNTACTDDEIAAGIIGVGVGIGIGGLDNDHDHHHHRRDNFPPPRYRRPDYGRRPGYGPGYGPGRPHRGYALETQLATPFDTTEVNSEVMAFSKKYNVSVDAAAKIQSAFIAVESKGLAALQTIGLNKNDLKVISKRHLPEASTMKSLAEKLDISEAQSKDLLKDMIQEFAAQASNIESNYWQSCMAKGKWKTPQNAYCKTTSWDGCAPESGATLCY